MPKGVRVPQSSPAGAQCTLCAMLSPTSAAPSQELRRVIGLGGGIELIVGITIGSGIFRTPPTIAGLVPNPVVFMALWSAFGLISVCGALTVAELSSLLPQPGGVYVFLREAYGDAAAFVFGWLYVLITTPTTVAALAVVFAEFLLNLLGTPVDARVQLIAIAAIVLLTFANVLGARVGVAVSGVTTTVKVTALAAIILGAFLLGHGDASNITAGGPAPERGPGRGRSSDLVSPSAASRPPSRSRRSRPSSSARFSSVTATLPTSRRAARCTRVAWHAPSRPSSGRTTAGSPSA